MNISLPKIKLEVSRTCATPSLREMIAKQTPTRMPKRKLEVSRTPLLLQDNIVEQFRSGPRKKKKIGLFSDIERAQKYCYDLNRDMLSFQVRMQLGEDNAIPMVKVCVSNKDTKESILLKHFEFTEALSTLQDEHDSLKAALKNRVEYTTPETHDPARLFMDHTTYCGSATIFPEYLQYMFETEEGEEDVPIKCVTAAREIVGTLAVVWTPLAGPDDEKPPKQCVLNDSPQELLGKPWTYRLEIRGASSRKMCYCCKTYVRYEFFGEVHETPVIDTPGSKFNFQYSHVHHVESVTQEFLDFLTKPMAFHVHAAPYTAVRKGRQPSTSDPVVVRRMMPQVIRDQEQELDGLRQLLRENKNQLQLLKSRSESYE